MVKIVLALLAMRITRTEKADLTLFDKNNQLKNYVMHELIE